MLVENFVNCTLFVISYMQYARNVFQYFGLPFVCSLFMEAHGNLPFTKKGVILMWCWYDILGGYVKTEEVSRDFDTRILNKVYISTCAKHSGGPRKFSLGVICKICMKF